MTEIKFTTEQRKVLATCWKRPSKAKSEQIERFIDDVERHVNYKPAFLLSNPSKMIKAYGEIAGDAHRLRLALERLPKGDAQHLEAMLGSWIREYGAPVPDRLLPALADLNMRILLRLVGLLELYTGQLADQKVRPGPNKSREYTIAAGIAYSYERRFGKPPSLSPGGNFMAFVAEIKVATGLEIGESTLKRVFKDYF